MISPVFIIKYIIKLFTLKSKQFNYLRLIRSEHNKPRRTSCVLLRRVQRAVQRKHRIVTAAMSASWQAGGEAFHRWILNIPASAREWFSDISRGFRSKQDSSFSSRCSCYPSESPTHNRKLPSYSKRGHISQTVTLSPSRQSKQKLCSARRRCRVISFYHSRILTNICQTLTGPRF